MGPRPRCAHRSVRVVARELLTALPERGCSTEVRFGLWRAKWCAPNGPGPRRGDRVHFITIRRAEPERVCVGRCPGGDYHAVPGHDSGVSHPRPVGRSVGGVSHRLVAVACRVAQPVCRAGLRRGGSRRRPGRSLRVGAAGSLPVQSRERSCLSNPAQDGVPHRWAPSKARRQGGHTSHPPARGTCRDREQVRSQLRSAMRVGQAHPLGWDRRGQFVHSAGRFPTFDGGSRARVKPQGKPWVCPSRLPGT